MSRVEAELEMVEILRTSDPVRAGLVRGALEHVGIPVAAPGMQANAVMPHLRDAIEVVLRVPSGDAERARRLVAELEREVEEEPVPAEDAPYREAAKRRPAPSSPRLKRVAAAVTFLFPGGGHFYVQRYAGGLAVVGGYVLAFVAMAMEVPWSGYLLAVPWLGDLVGALDGCERSWGRSGSPAPRFAPVASLAAIGLWSALALGPLLPHLAGEESVVFCDYVARCEDRDAQRCLRDAANLGPSLPEPACLACIERERGCEAVEAGCQAQCWPAPAPRPFAIDPLFGL